MAARVAGTGGASGGVSTVHATRTTARADDDPTRVDRDDSLTGMKRYFVARFVSEILYEVRTMSKPRIVITYCRQCNWMLRATWMAQELLSTFADGLGEVALVPATGGVFRIEYEGELVWERKRDGGFPDAKVLKQRVRDRLDPERQLGHIDRGL